MVSWMGAESLSGFSSQPICDTPCFESGFLAFEVLILPISSDIMLWEPLQP